MRFSSDTSNGFCGLAATQFIRAWMRTLDARAAYYDPTLDPCLATPQKRIYVFWHENILLPLFFRGSCNIVTLMSQHRDADVLVRMAEQLGFGCVRGSSFRGGTRALKQLVSVARDKHLAMTPDGPRGPRRQLEPGAVFLAAKLQMPIVPIGVGYDRPWRLRSWDRFAVPRPMSSARAIVGPAIHIPREASRDALEAYRAYVEQVLDQLSDEAEAWAAAGSRKNAEQVIAPQACRKTPPHSCYTLHVA